ncbi:hypothetical protein Pelo_2139 [Pelomyxa schiedti]|nr:hypothetical protein Pelo_2139 [Pelomyxa schiedti]
MDCGYFSVLTADSVVSAKLSTAEIWPRCNAMLTVSIDHLWRVTRNLSENDILNVVSSAKCCNCVTLSEVTCKRCKGPGGKVLDLVAQDHCNMDGTETFSFLVKQFCSSSKTHICETELLLMLDFGRGFKVYTDKFRLLARLYKFCLKSTRSHTSNNKNNNKLSVSPPLPPHSPTTPVFRNMLFTEVPALVIRLFATTYSAEITQRFSAAAKFLASEKLCGTCNICPIEDPKNMHLILEGVTVRYCVMWISYSNPAEALKAMDIFPDMYCRTLALFDALPEKCCCFAKFTNW